MKIRNPMKLSDKTISVLKNFSSINQSILFKEGSKLRTISLMKNILAEATVTEEFSKDFGIYDLNQFLNGLSVHQSPELDFANDGYVVIREGRSRSKYYKVGSDRYTNLEGIEKFSMPLFANNKGETNFSLVIGFPNRVSYLRSSISFLIILSIVFTLVIIISFVSTILSSIRQKNISEMKTDFINNMTHEFKTPIATIDLSSIFAASILA